MQAHLGSIEDPVIQASEIHREVIKRFGIGLLFKDQCSFTMDSGLKVEGDSAQKPLQEVFQKQVRGRGEGGFD